MRVRVAHVSLEAGDSDKQHTADLEKIFSRSRARKTAWITGTEAGPGGGNLGRELVRIGRKYGYKLWVPSNQKSGSGSATDAWVAVRENLVDRGSWKQGFILGIPGSKQLYEDQGKDGDLSPRWGPKGLVHVQFKSTASGLGVVNVGAAHYLTKARSPKAPKIHGVDHWEQNKKLTDVIGKWAREEGKGRALVFYGGDQNMADNKNKEPQGDTFMGEPLTSMWDEVKFWENTGHGNIDVIASYDKDGRVKALHINALNDRQFFLHGDHFYVEGVFNVEPLKR